MWKLIDRGLSHNPDCIHLGPGLKKANDSREEWQDSALGTSREDRLYTRLRLTDFQGPPGMLTVGVAH